MVSLSEVLRAMYSASLDESVIRVCILDAHISGHPAYSMIKPVLDRAISGSSGAPSGSQFLLKSELTYTSNELPLGLRINPLSLVVRRYLPIHLTAFVCARLGSAENVHIDARHKKCPVSYTFPDS